MSDTQHSHDMQEISIRPVAIVRHPSNPSPVVVPLGEPEFGVGCGTCGMSMEDAMKKPCPGKLGPQGLVEITRT
jgi:hypothetical protein